MVSIILLSTLVIAVLYIFYKYATYRPHNFPPGPPRIPFFGSYLWLLLIDYKWTHKASMFMSKFYSSNIIGLYLGDTPTVIAHSYEGIKEILYRPEFDGRPDGFPARLRDPLFNLRGIFFQDGTIWKEQRRFFLRYLRDFGFGRRYPELEIVINEELTDLVNLIKSGPKFDHEKEIVRTKGQVLCPYFMSGCSTNALLYIMCKERIPRDERGIINRLVKDGMIFQRQSDGYGRLISLRPSIRHFFPYKSGYRPLRDTTQTIRTFFAKIVDKNLNTYDESHDRNFIDMYIREMKKSEQNENIETSFDYDQFLMSLVDFGFPAITGIGMQLSLLFQWMLLRPDILKKIQQEIDSMVGSGRLPCLDDRNVLSYTEATLRECLRIETLVPSSVPHEAVVDTELLGYNIPKDTIVFPGLYAFHMDKTIWKDPDFFRPERFLDENGKLCLKKDISFPFGAGKRLCAGETFARNMLFLITAAICQNFDIVLGPNEKPPDMTKTLSGLGISPPDFWLNLRER